MQPSAAKLIDPVPECVPLVVDLNGTLIKSDLLIESAFAHIGHQPALAGALLAALFRGKAAFKTHIAAATDINAALLPYDDRVIDCIRKARAAGRLVYLASASSERYVQAVADHLGIFDGWFASNGTVNLSSSAKAERLAYAFGIGGFDYIGNSTDDLAVWSKARQCIAIHPTKAVAKKLLALDPTAVILRRDGPLFRDWIRLLRVHQWVKNILVFVPLITAQHFDLLSFGQALVAFVAFSLAASGIYVINDIADIESDRKHRSKKRRPLAAGTVPILKALIVALILIAMAALAALMLNQRFAIVLLGYFALTTAYTFLFKKKMMIDVVVLAMLYTLRVVGGAAVIVVPVSEWLLAFSAFIFLGLALIKRYTELAGLLDANMPDPVNRDYRKEDLDIIAALAAASGFSAVIVFTLYANSETARANYTSPEFLWIACPILIYWIGRILLLAHRRQMNDDPIVFALRDSGSLGCAAIISLAFLLAVVGIPFGWGLS